MVSIVLLTTEEVLRRNGFWYCLDSDWITEEMEPFEEIKPEDLFSKPLSRDFYYAKFPEIPRSESEDENSLSLNGFKIKHREWKSKINVKRFYAQKRNSCNSRTSLNGVFTTSSASLNVGFNKVVSSSGNKRLRTKSDSGICANSNNMKGDFDCLPPKNTSPPPPVITITNATRSESLDQENYCNETELLDADDEIQLKQSNLKKIVPKMSSLKRTKRKVSFNLDTHKDDFDFQQSWNESIYGVSDFGVELIGINSAGNTEYLTANDLQLSGLENYSCSDDFPSWTDIINECDVSACLLSKGLWSSTEELISKSHNADDTSNQLFHEDDVNDDEATYARFAIYKIHQTLTNEIGMTDSSSMKDLIYEENERIAESQRNKNDTSFLDELYRIAPKTREELTSTL